jgi:hypothetical protein
MTALTTLAFILHVSAGTLALFSGAAAVIARKGGRLHRAAGTVFFGSMLVMATFAAYLAVAMPGQIVNLFIAAFTAYLLVTAWLTVRRRQAGLAERIALAVALVLCAPFAVLSIQLASGLAPFIKSATPFEGPVLIAIYSFTGVLAIAVVGDARLVLAGGVTGAARLARHLWRMCLGLMLAAGSAFTNGLPRLLPASVHVPLAVLFVPQLLVLGLLIFWMIRVRFTGWSPRPAVANPGRPEKGGRIAPAA